MALARASYKRQRSPSDCANERKKEDMMKTFIDILDEIREKLNSARKDALNMGENNIVDKIDSAVDALNDLEP